jgi:hypothetical protein
LACSILVNPPFRINPRQKNEDGINKRWGNESQSPVEKYAKAFRINPTRLAQRISDISGVDGEIYDDSIWCRTDEDCSDLKDHACGIRRGKSQGVCMPDWYGICHTWAPAAILEEEPRCDVVKNGVLFKLLDIKALVSQSYVLIANE